MQTTSPRRRFHGAQMIALGYTRQPWPICAPKRRKRKLRHRWNGRGLNRKSTAQAAFQRPRRNRFRNGKLGRVRAVTSNTVSIQFLPPFQKRDQAAGGPANFETAGKTAAGLRAVLLTLVRA